MKKYIKLYSVIAICCCNLLLYAQPTLSPLGNNRVGYGRGMFTDTVANLFYGGTSIISEASPDSCFSMFSWNGNQWECMTTGQNERLGAGNTIMTIQRFQNTLYVGGALGHAIDTTNYAYYKLLKQTNNGWIPAIIHSDTTYITGNEGIVGAGLPINDTIMYVSGTFDTLARVPAQGIIAFDGHQLHRLPNFLPNIPHGSTPHIGAMAYYKNHLYAGGNMDLTAGTGYNDMARLDGDHWSQVGTGFGGAGIIGSMVVFQDKLIVGGWFGKAQGDPGNGCAAWDGTQWTPMDAWVGGGTGTLNPVVVYKNELYGYLAKSGLHKLVKWTGSVWAEVLNFPVNPVTGAVNQITMMSAYQDDLYIGGYFIYNGKTNHILKFNNITGISEVGASSNELHIFPNPTSGSLSLTHATGTALRSYTIADISGKIIAQNASIPSDNTLHLDLPNGVYFLIINDANGVMTRHKVVVLK